MAKAEKRSIFLTGVKLKDCVDFDAMFEEKLMEQANDEKEIVQYRKVPDVYKGIGSWPKKTDMLCWHCSMCFDGPPVFVPKTIDPIDGGACNLSVAPISLQEVVAGLERKNSGGMHQASPNLNRSKYSMVCDGCFCSFNCALAYIDYTYLRSADNNNRKNMLDFLFREWYGIAKPFIEKTLPKTKMVQYGGNMTPQAFRQLIMELQVKSGITPLMMEKWRRDFFLTDNTTA